MDFTVLKCSQPGLLAVVIGIMAFLYHMEVVSCIGELSNPLDHFQFQCHRGIVKANSAAQCFKQGCDKKIYLHLVG